MVSSFLNYLNVRNREQFRLTLPVGLGNSSKVHLPAWTMISVAWIVAGPDETPFL